jgi:hypothetical protein
MKIDKVGENQFRLDLSSDELISISNCLNETIEAIDEFEFQTRIGVDLDNISSLLKSMHAALDQG